MGTTDQYPRPDFERANLNWKSLNGPWTFVFDDKDIGLEEGWHKNGVPATKVSFVYPILCSGTSELAFIRQLGVLLVTPVLF